MENFKKDLVCNICLIFTLLCTVVHLLIITLNLFGVTELEFSENFNYIVGYVLVAVCLLLYVLGFFISSIKGLTFPAWLRIVFYIAFFIFTNTYYILGWHQNIIAVVFMFAYIAFCVNIISISVFYNAQKDDKNRLKSTKKFISTSIFFYSVGTLSIIELILTAIKAFFFPDYVMTTLLVMVTESCTMLFVTIIMTIIFYLSLSKRKIIVNKSLIKYSKNPTIQRSVREKYNKSK